MKLFSVSSRSFFIWLRNAEYLLLILLISCLKFYYICFTFYDNFYRTASFKLYENRELEFTSTMELLRLFGIVELFNIFYFSYMRRFISSDTERSSICLVFTGDLIYTGLNIADCYNILVFYYSILYIFVSIYFSFFYTIPSNRSYSYFTLSSYNWCKNFSAYCIFLFA